MSEVVIEYYRIRDFGQKFNATIEFIRKYFKSLIKILLLIAVPVGLIMGILFSNLMQTAFDFGASGEINDVEALGIFGTFLSSYMLFMIVAIVAGSVTVGSIYSFMRLVENAVVPPQLGDVFKQMSNKLGGMLVIVILSAIMTIVGAMLFFIPGIYIGIVMTLAIPSYSFSDISIGEAIGRPFKLIKGKWWSTFGLLMVSTLVAGFVSYLFLIPMYVLMFASMFSTLENGISDPQAMGDMYSSLTMVAGMAVGMVGSYLTYVIPTIALAFQYFNLTERTEGKGLKSQIEGFEALK